MAIEMKALVLLFWLAALASALEQTVFFKADGELSLTPPRASAIRVITWKLDGDLAAEWNGVGPVTYFRTFAGRSDLDTETGELRIRRATAEFAGLFTVELNDVDVSEVSWRGVLLAEVPEPTVEPKPLACSRTSPRCSLLCAGNTSRAGAVTYQWRRDDGDWTDGGKTLDVENDDATKAVRNFLCALVNPVSRRESAPFLNPFGGPPVADHTVAVVVSVFLVLALLLGGVGGWCVKTGKYKDYLPVGSRPSTNK